MIAFAQTDRSCANAPTAIRSTLSRAANYAMQLLIADRFQHDGAYESAALDILHYLLGRNTFATSWVTGVGTRSVMHPHHRPSIADGIVAPWPGLLVGGPNHNRQDPVLRQLSAGVAPARAWIDDQGSYSGNEVAINWNAPLVFLLAAIAKPKVAVFRAPDFPTVDAPQIPDATLDDALKDFDVLPLERLNEARALVLPYGSAFPVERLRATSPHITVSRDWMRRDGKVFPIIGTTYMASDVHREFLFEPNPEVWDRDFALMQRLGINFVRTGLWSGWSRVDENARRALDMFVAAAAKHDIVVCFTFFAFLPPAYGGTNPYLDPRSIKGQEEFITAIARRYRGIGWVQYDLINEPSYAPPNKLWNTVPIGDEWEQRAYHGNSRFDFILFTQGAVAGWAAHMREVIRQAAGDALVTLGQDEGGTSTRSSQPLHAAAVDYTSMHPWWNNDDVLSSGLFAKVPEKPMLFEEVGLMRLEDKNGWPVRSPEVSADMIDRKFAYAFAARGAGAVEWAWNINPYMPIDNESVIGFFRPDGTAKPELDVIPKFARFFRDAAPWLDDFAPDPVIAVIPQSRIFMEDPHAIDGFRRLIHVLAERFGIVPMAISDLRLTANRVRDARVVIKADDADFERALAKASIATNPGTDGVAVRLLDAPRAILAILVNETPAEVQRTLNINGRAITVAVPAGRSRLMLFDRANGNLIADTSPLTRSGCAGPASPRGEVAAKRRVRDRQKLQGDVRPRDGTVSLKNMPRRRKSAIVASTSCGDCTRPPRK